MTDYEGCYRNSRGGTLHARFDPNTLVYHVRHLDHNALSFTSALGMHKAIAEGTLLMIPDAECSEHAKRKGHAMADGS